jgi:hypothetical protein
MDTRWLDEDERAAWLRLIAVVELLPGVLDAQLRADSGLTHFEYFVRRCCRRHRSGRCG